MPHRDAAAANAMIVASAANGHFDTAERLFSGLQFRHDLTSWNAMIEGYARNGRVDLCVSALRAMELEGWSPSGASYLSALAAFAHAGLVEEAAQCVASMQGDGGIQASREHFNRYVDVLARAGRVEEAMELAATMPFVADEVSLSALFLNI
ncbi:hypothetical protein SELMODRAFT_117641 [Selaginella moellendorffii]|uniref:Pentacotripeptide-repeat region of PRORP domain-containing protein n=2 Tax=Selaginella moellendorffii TaxID=88036 RepID=D8SIB0_SELML|nr:hypothetical protein SELMODRAFT_117641 [Selaginella moellendorffii]